MFAAFVRINRAGFRDDDHVLEKGDGVYRVAVIGDSFIEAIQVEKEERATELLGEALALCQDPRFGRVEVLNFGISGYGTGQELLVWRDVASRYSPDLVLLYIQLSDFLPAALHSAADEQFA